MIFVGADHRGRLLEEDLLAALKELNLSFELIGEEHFSAEDDYPDFALDVVLKMLSGEAGIDQNLGILICGSGQGIMIAANRFRGIRAGLCKTAGEVKVAREDDKLNVLCLSADELKLSGNARKELTDLIKTFVETEFKSAPKYQRRIEKLDRLP